MKLSFGRRAQGSAIVSALFLATALAFGSTAASASTACSSTGSGLLRVGSTGASVRNLQSCLPTLGYIPHGVDGAFGDNTKHAVITFQKDHGLSRDGVVGPQTRAVLRIAGSVVMPAGCRSVDKVCVSLHKQVMYLRLSSGIRAVDTSSENGQYYTTTMGRRALAVTPTGHAVVCRQLLGLDRSTSVKNGILYDPSYLNYGSRCSGIAFHGEPGINSVPPYPVSHGCMRVIMSNSRLVHDNLRVGSPVSVVA
ncbi:MAG TPA: L,D-transpeptidase family protein [Dermatophilaceae bacterium]|nr:L,D-transpeptidase family protein [Dermatophilaceae bacterium]